MTNTSDRAADRTIRTWLIRQLGTSDVASGGTLPGSTSATLYCYRAVLPRGSAIDVVVKQYNTAIPTDHARELARLEVNGLLAAAQTRVPVPRLLLHDITGDATGHVDVLLTANEMGANFTRAGIRETLVAMARNALIGRY
jgi:hypothetical protein